MVVASTTEDMLWLPHILLKVRRFLYAIPVILTIDKPGKLDVLLLGRDREPISQVFQDITV
jgi:hypothetical protein